MTSKFFNKLPKLSVKILAIFLLCQFILFFVVSWIYMDKSYSMLETQFDERGKTLACHLADSCKYGLLTRNTELLANAINNIIHQPDVVGVKVLDSHGWIVYSLNWNEGSNMQVFKAPVVAEVHFSEDENLMSLPKRGKKQLIGRVDICLSKDGLIYQASRLRRVFMFMAFLGLCGVGVIGWLGFHFLVIRRINYLTDKVKQISREQLNVQIEMGGHDEITTLSQCFNTMQQQIEASFKEQEALMQEKIDLANKMKEHEKLALLGRFVSELRHEVGNSLNNFSMIHYRLSQEKLSVQGHLALDNFMHQIKELIRFNNDIKNCFYAPQVRPKDVDVAELMRIQKAALSLVGGEQSVNIIWDLPGICHARIDFDLIRRALENLILNAVDAVKDDGGEVRVKLKCMQDHLEISVTDDGYGIDSAAQEDIFMPFFTTKKHGSGLGLVIARSFVEAHGGRLVLESNTSKTCFKMLLPKYPHLKDSIPDL